LASRVEGRQRPARLAAGAELLGGAGFGVRASEQIEMRKEGLMYALFRDKTQLGKTFSTEKEVWEAALAEGLVSDIPVADEAGGQVLPIGYHVVQLAEDYDPQPDWKPKES
jgi:hypothetical protein